MELINRKEVKAISSLEVAKMVDKRHDHLIRDIRNYIDVISTNPNLGALDFFIETTYQDIKNETRPMYLLTKLGCEMVANKMTGEKGILFTAMYVKKFNEMEIQKQLPSDYKEALLALYQSEVAKEQMQLELTSLKPKAEYYDLILKNKGLVTITQIAKDYGMSGQSMNELLHQLEIQYKQSNQWLLYRKFDDKGYTHSETISITRRDGRPDVSMITKWTQKGRMFLYDLLKDNGILPNIEKGE